MVRGGVFKSSLGGKKNTKMIFHVILSRANPSVPVDDVEEPSALLIMLKGDATLSSRGSYLHVCCYAASFLSDSL